jgi:hypothetical protein
MEAIAAFLNHAKSGRHPMPFWKKKSPPSEELSDATLDAYLALLRSKGWTITESSGAVALNQEFQRRHPRIPEQYMKFLTKVASCVNKDETVWFNCVADYNGTSDAGFAWNEFEKMDLEGAGDNQEWRDETISFWDNHLPFLMSVGGEYAHRSFRVGDEKFGSVVDGYEELTAVSDFASSFADFIRLHSDEVNEKPRTLPDFI